jgi:hypothetical protein
MKYIASGGHERKISYLNNTYAHTMFDMRISDTIYIFKITAFWDAAPSFR